MMKSFPAKNGIFGRNPHISKSNNHSCPKILYDISISRSSPHFVILICFTAISLLGLYDDIFELDVCYDVVGLGVYDNIFGSGVCDDVIGLDVCYNIFLSM